MNLGSDTMPRDFFKGRQCDLVELSAGSVDGNQPNGVVSFDEWDQPSCPRHTRLYKFVNVLWIECVGEVAHRKALGRVEKEKWDAVAFAISVTLG